MDLEKYSTHMRLKLSQDQNNKFSLNDFWKLGVWGDAAPKVIPKNDDYHANQTNVSNYLTR